MSNSKHSHSGGVALICAVGIVFAGCGKPSAPPSGGGATNAATPAAEILKPASGTKGAVEVTVAPAQKSPPPYNQVFVICVGVNRNPAYGDLRFAVSDATDLAESFRGKFGFTNVVLLTDTNATRQKIIEAIEAIRPRLSPDGKDDFIFLYSGHGDTRGEGVVQNGVTNVTRYGFLVTYDPATEQPKSLDEIRARHLEMGEVAKQVSSLPARHRLMFVDSCFSGLAFVQRDLVNSRVEELYEDVIATPTVQIMTAGLDSEPVLEDSQTGHGVFTDALLQQLRAGDVRTMEEIFFPLRLAVRASLVRMNKPMSMTPQHRYLLYTNGTFVFVPLSKRDSWAAVRPANSVVAAAAQNGAFKPVTPEEVNNLSASANSKSKEEWSAEVERYETRAAMGDPYANVALSRIYTQGIGVPQNPNRARIYGNEGNDLFAAARTFKLVNLVDFGNPIANEIANEIARRMLPSNLGGSKLTMRNAGFAGGKVTPETLAAGAQLFGDLAKANGNDSASTNAAEKDSGFKFPGIGSNPKAVVKIPFQGTTTEVAVELKGLFLNKQAKNGVSALQVGDLATAIRELTDAVKDKPKNEQYQFALAVAMEATGDYAGARTHYAEANRLAGGKGLPEALAGIKRISDRGK